MKSAGKTIVATVIIILAFLVYLQRRNHTIKSEDLTNGKIVLIGKLGRPIGTRIKIRCVYVDEEKPKLIKEGISGYIEIDQINGATLPSKIRYPLTQVSLLEYGREELVPKQSDSFVCDAFETTSYFGNPMDEIDGTIVQGDPACFATLLRIARILPVLKPL